MQSMVEGAATNASPGGSVSWPTAPSDKAKRPHWVGLAANA